MTDARRKWVAGGVVYGGISIIALLVIFAVVQTFGLVSQMRQTQKTNVSAIQAAQSAAESADRGTNRIEDCTTPGRACYDEGQKRTADVITDLNRVAVYAAACADRPGVQGSEEIYACVIQLLADDDGQGG